MEWMPTLALVLAVFFFVLGFLGNVVPVLPGAILVFAGIVIHKLMMGPESVSWWFVLGSMGAVILAQALDLVSGWLGAKRFGATWKGGLGAAIGGIAGMFLFFPIGLIVLPIVGAFVGELLHSPDLRRAGRAGLGTVVGGILAFVMKLAVTIAMIVAFFFALPGEVSSQEATSETSSETLDLP